MRGGIKAGNSQLVDGMIHDGLWDSFSDTHMGNLRRVHGQEAGVSRADQDAFRAGEPPEGVGRNGGMPLQDGDCPGRDPRKKGPTVVEKDEGPRKETSLDALAALKPSFQKDADGHAGQRARV